MKQFLATVSNIQPLTSTLQFLTLSSSDLPQMRAGQLLLARWPGQYEPYVRAAHFAIPSAEACSIIVNTSEHEARPYSGAEHAGSPDKTNYATAGRYKV